MFERTYNFAIAIFYIFLSFFYIYIILLKFSFLILDLDFDFEDFDCKNLVNYNLAILNILINNKLRFFFYNILILIKLNFNNFFIKYFSKNCAILFD